MKHILEKMLGAAITRDLTEYEDDLVALYAANGFCGMSKTSQNAFVLLYNQLAWELLYADCIHVLDHDPELMWG